MLANTYPIGFLPVSILEPAADAAGRTGDYINVGGATGKIFLSAYINQGNAATIALTPTQATSNAGAGAKALSAAVRIFSNQDCAANGGADDLTETSATSFTTSAAVKVKQVIFEITPIGLDTANGFNYITLVTGASNAANITSAMALMELAYAGGSTFDPIA